MPSQVFPKRRGAPKAIYIARVAVVIAMAMCGAGFVVCANRYEDLIGTVNSGVWHSGVRAFEIGLLACLTAVAGLIGESLLRSLQGRPLRAWGLVAAAPIGLIACITVLGLLGVGCLLYNNLGSHSASGVLALAVIVCLVGAIGLVIDGLRRSRQGRRTSVARYEFAVAGLLGFMAFVGFAVFWWQRADEGDTQHQTVEALKALDCSVYYDYLVADDGHSFSKGSSRVPDWLFTLVGKDFFHRVARVNVTSPDPSPDALLPHLRALPGLEYLVLSPEVAPEKIRQIEQALPSCRIRYTTTLGAECSPWPPPPPH